MKNLFVFMILLSLFACGGSGSSKPPTDFGNSIPNIDSVKRSTEANVEAGDDKFEKDIERGIKDLIEYASARGKKETHIGFWFAAHDYRRDRMALVHKWQEELGRRGYKAEIPTVRLDDDFVYMTISWE